MMTSHAIINITSLLDEIKNGKTAQVIEELEFLHSKEGRGYIFSEQEILMMLSAYLKECATGENSIVDKMVRILWRHSNRALKSKGIIDESP